MLKRCPGSAPTQRPPPGFPSRLQLLRAPTISISALALLNADKKYPCTQPHIPPFSLLNTAHVRWCDLRI